jgi:ABC-2 type transport system ATP-binding protein
MIGTGALRLVPLASPDPETPAESPRTLLDLDGVRLSYGHVLAVRDLDLEVRRGETFGLLGPNGAGKSSLMRLIAGVARPDTGTIRLGRDAVETLSARARIGIAPQDIALYGNLTAEENLAFFGRLHGLSGARLGYRVESCLALAGLAERRSHRVKTFSGGMQRRLNLACAVVHEPELVLLDEPTAGVDPQSRNHIFEALEMLRADGLTIVYSTHYMEEAERLCDRIGIIDQGRLLALGTLPELVARYGGRYRLEVGLDGDLPASFQPSPELDGHRARFVTDDPWPILSAIWHARMGVKSVHLERPSLETVFLSLTGRSLRD